MVASTQAAGDPFTDPVYKGAVVDLLGAIGYGEISAFERLTDDAAMAPSLEDKLALLALANRQFAKVEPVRARLAELTEDPFAAMEPFHEAIDSFHSFTAPGDWWEALVKAYVGDGIVGDFYREISAFLDEETRALITSTLSDEGETDFAIARIRAGIAADHKLGGRLALWGRRLMGEALTQTQHVAASRDALTEILAGNATFGGLDLAGIGEMFTRVTTRHIERMATLGLEH
ncbi:ferritin-like fold-containing protein [Nocardioides sp. Kera G14]|uniref:ferritin-like fold-containing protein n=1 Tax=Nocardioides sp. Kera G14 TaxID=2884264 RepID=UPI001D11D6C5|nr:ferritin-like fold-containing protein [Nocardioides sp. Kera G14]UDY24563.1 ferritin-like domain-containing protein [Nocardioides sp. Kera G14]